MIIVYHLMQFPQALARKSDRLLRDIEGGRYTGTITTWTRSEFLGVMRTMLAQSNDRVPTAEELGRAEERFTNLIAQLGLEFLDADILANQGSKIELFAKAEAVIRNSQPVRRSVDRKWTGIGGADGMHGELARRSGAQELMTFDEGFRGAVIPGVSPVIVGDRY